MKKNNNNKSALKQGAASFYVVIFTTILFGIITVSFIQIILSEVRQTTNFDLSESAYDSALAGIEDAKIALLKYHNCISQGNLANTNEECKTLIDTMQAKIADDSCDTVQAVLGRAQGDQGEVIIQETQTTTGDGGRSASLQQAYTCVKIQEELADYRSTLDTNNRLRMVPLRPKSDMVDNITGVRIKWYSTNNTKPTGEMMGKDEFTPHDGSQPSAPPVVIAQLIQTDLEFNLREELDYTNGKTQTDRATAVLHPVSSGDITHLTADDMTSTNDKAPNEPYNINCTETSKNPAGEFYCTATLAVPATYRNGSRNPASFFLRLSLPYGAPKTDFAVEMCTDNDATSGNCVDDSNNLSTAKFVGVQAQVDSTGRANDLFRRIEARVELVDTNFPFPEFAIQISNQDDDAKLKKNFWITDNCWFSEGGKTGVGVGSSHNNFSEDNSINYGCDNNGEIPET